MIRSFVNQNAFLNSLTEEQKEHVSLHSTFTDYKKDQIIFYEGTMPFGVYIIISGKVMLYQTGTQGKKQIFELCRSGDIFGFQEVLTGEPYPDSAATIEHTKVQFIPKQIFLELIQSSSQLSFSFLKALSSEFREFIDFETMLAQKPVRERVAIVLCRLSRFYEEESEKKKIIIPLSRNDLADLCGTVKETLVRVLSEFKKSGYIKSVGLKEIEILDFESLQKIADY